MAYTVKKVAELTGISVRTLHYYDEIDLLKPSHVGQNGYRYYDDAALLRLQQILLYREMGMELAQIGTVLDDPDFDLLTALRSHRKALQARLQHLHQLIRTVDGTMMHLIGEIDMNKRRLFDGFSDQQQKQHERELRLEYGPDTVNESIRRWNSYTEAERARIKDEGEAIYADLAEALNAGEGPNSSVVQAILTRWHAHLHHFYEPTLEILECLGQMYNTHPDFIARFEKMHPELPVYLQSAVTHYVDELETAEIIRLLAEDELRGAAS